MWREVNVRVEGQLVFNNLALRIDAALEDLGLANLPEDRVQDQIAAGRLIQVLAEWCQPFSGYHLYTKPATPHIGLRPAARRVALSRHFPDVTMARHRD